MSTPSSTQPAIIAQDLTKTYQDTTAVHKLSIEVSQGECLALLGPNGAGKTTMCEMLEGLTTPDSGTLQILGMSYKDNSSAIRERIGVLMQETTLYKKFTVRETLELFASFYKEHYPIDKLLSEFNLEEKANDYLESLSGGLKQRAYIACALVNHPDVLFLDEPTTGLDPTARRNLWEVMKKVKERGCSILLTTHYMEEATELSDRIAIMDRGQIISEGTSDSLIAEHCPGEVITLDVSGDQKTGLKEKIAATLATEVTSQADDRLLFNVSNAAIAIPTIYQLSKANGIHIDGIKIHRSNLEDVFIKLSGRSIEQAEGINATK